MQQLDKESLERCTCLEFFTCTGQQQQSWLLQLEIEQNACDLGKNLFLQNCQNPAGCDAAVTANNAVTDA